MVSRTLWDDPAFADEPFSEREAWIWMIAEACWKPREKRVGSIVVELDRGQFAASIRFMAEAFSWHRNRVHRLLKRLQSRNMIRVESGTGVNVVSICKYDEYQLSPKHHGTAAGQQRDSSGTNENKGNKGNNNTSSNDDGFDEFWRHVPRKVGKGQAVKAYRAARKKVSHDKLVSGIKAYADSVSGTDPQFVAHPATWLNGERWADEGKTDTRTWRDKHPSEWTARDRKEERMRWL